METKRRISDLQRNFNFSDSVATDAQALDGALCCTDLFDTHPTLPLRSPSLFLMGLERRLPASRNFHVEDERALRANDRAAQMTSLQRTTDHGCFEVTLLPQCRPNTAAGVSVSQS